MVAVHVEGVTADRAEEPVRREPRGVLAAGLLVVVAATAFRIWVIRPTWFYFDDFYFIEQAREKGLTLSFLGTNYNGHLMPASWFMTWVNARADPFGFSYPAAEIVIMSALMGLGFLRLLLTLFGHRPAVLFPLVLGLFSPLLLPATTWWAAAVNQLPMLISLTFGLAAFVRHLRDRRTSQLVASLAWLALGLAFVERTLIVVVMMWLVALMYFASGTVPGRVAHVLRTYRAAVLSHAVLVTAYLVLYLSIGTGYRARSVATQPFFSVMKYVAGITFPTTVTGGPLRWRLTHVTQNEPHPTQVVLILSWLVVAAVVWASVRTRRRAARAWLLPLSALTANVLLIAITRAVFFGASISLDPRFQTEVAILMPLAVGLAFLPVPGAVESSEPKPSGWRLDTRATVLSATVVFLVAATVSASTFPLRNLTAATSPRAYVETFAASASEHQGDQVLDRPVRGDVWSPIAYPSNLASRLLAPAAGHLDFRAATTDDAWRVDHDGSLVPLAFVEDREQLSEPNGQGCFAELRGGSPSAYALDGPVLGVDWYARLYYTASAPTQLEVIVGGNHRKVQLEAGQHYVLVPAGGQYDSVAFALPSGSPSVCLRHLGIVSITGL